MDLASIISKTTFEKQGLALLNGTVSGPQRVQFIAIVNFVAWIFLLAHDSSFLSQQLRTSVDKKWKAYEQNMTAALRQISILDLPSFSLLQALLAGVSAP